MCDYSLMNVPNRLANEGEILVTHKFATGSIGFASPYEIADSQVPARPEPGSFWNKVWAWFVARPAVCQVPAVCIPPGAQLKILTVSESMRSLSGAEPLDEVTFTQITANWNQYRDALRTRTGQEILLQTIGEGVTAVVANLSLVEERKPVREGYNYTLVPRR